MQDNSSQNISSLQGSSFPDGFWVHRGSNDLIFVVLNESEANKLVANFKTFLNMVMTTPSLPVHPYDRGHPFTDIPIN